MIKAHVIMPVFRGGDLWHQALRSLADCRHLFDEVVMSFDGPNRAAQTGYAHDNYAKTLRAHLLVTPREMSSLQHVQWFMRQSPVSTFQDHDLLCVWAEDDLAAPITLQSALAAARAIESPVIFGSWARLGCRDDLSDEAGGEVEGAYEVISERGTVSALSASAREGLPTSITCMTATAQTFRSHYLEQNANYGDRSLLNGYRTEYFIGTKPSVRHLIRFARPIAGIVQHDLQKNRTTPALLARSDEALYHLRLAVTRQSMPPKARALAFPQFLRKSLKARPLPPRLMCAVKTFWRTRSAANT